MSVETKKEQGHFRRNWVVYSLLILALGSAGFLFVSKNMALKSQAKIFETEKTMLLQQAQEAFDVNAAKHLELMMKTFVWAVRGELTRGNQEQVDQYFKQLVKDGKIEEVTFVNTKRKIILSTNKKNEGSPLATDYANAVMKVEEMTSIDKGDRQVVAAPVMSIDSRLGTLFLIYNKDIFHLQEKVDLTKNN